MSMMRANYVLPVEVIFGPPISVDYRVCKTLSCAQCIFTYEAFDLLNDYLASECRLPMCATLSGQAQLLQKHLALSDEAYLIVGELDSHHGTDLVNRSLESYPERIGILYNIDDKVRRDIREITVFVATWSRRIATIRGRSLAFARHDDYEILQSLQLRDIDVLG